MNNKNHLYLLLCEATPLIIFAYLAYLVLSQATNIPTGDQWAELFILEKYFENKLTLTDFFESYAGHILALPRLIWLSLALLTDWDTRYELVVNLILGLGIYLFYRRAVFNRLELDKTYRLLVVSGMAVFVFSFVQFQNWMWGWQIQIFLCSLFGLISIGLLATREINIGVFFLAICAAMLSIFSFAAGVHVWLIGFALLLIRCRKPPYLIIWLVLSIVCIGIDVVQSRICMPPGSLFKSDDPFTYMRFICVYIGAPVFITHSYTIAFYCGLFALLIAMVSLAYFIFTGSWKHPVVLFFTAMMAFALMTVILIAITRDVTDIDAACASRYMTFSIHFWISLIGLTAFYIKQQSSGKFIKILLLIGILLVTGASVLTSKNQIRYFYLYEERSKQIAFLKDHTDNKEGFYLGSIMWNDDYLFDLLRRAKKYHLTFYAED